MILLELLQRAGVEYKQLADKQHEVKLNCPFCVENGETEDERFRLGINIQNGLAHCYNCSWASGSFRRTARELCRVYGIKFNIHSLVFRHEETLNLSAKKEALPKPTGFPQGYQKFTNKNFTLLDPEESKARQYLTHRRVSRLQITRHQIGYATWGFFSGRIVFPVFGEDGAVYGACGRDFYGNLKPKYLNTPGIKMLWNAHQVNKTAVVTEGIFDALRVERAIVDGNVPGMVPVSRLGSAITALQLEQLTQFDNVIIFPDWDVPGVKGAAELATRCADAKIKTSVIVPLRMTGSDPGSFDTNDILNLLRMSSNWSRVTDYKLRLAATKEVA